MLCYKVVLEVVGESFRLHMRVTNNKPHRMKNDQIMNDESLFINKEVIPERT